MAKGRKVIALFAFTYAGSDLDRSELVELKGTPKDEQLVGLRYFAYYDAREHVTRTCDNCGRKFVGEAALIAHKRKPDCMAPQGKVGEPTKLDTAQLLDVDVERLKIDDASPVVPEQDNPMGLTIREDGIRS